MTSPDDLALRVRVTLRQLLWLPVPKTVTAVICSDSKESYNAHGLCHQEPFKGSYADLMTQ